MLQLTKTLSSKIRNMAVLCSLLVVVIHCRPNFSVNTGWWWLKQLLENGITQIAVPFFFLVSGFLLVGHVKFAKRSGCFCSSGWYWSEVVKRIRTLFVPFVIWNLLWILMTLPLTRSHNEQGDLGGPIIPSLSDWGLSPLNCPALVPLWYIRAVFILVLFSPLLIAALRRFGCRVLVVFYIVYGVCCPFVPMAWWTTVQSLTRCGLLSVQGFFYFTLGMALRMGIARDCCRCVPTVFLWIVGMGLVVTRAWFDERIWSCYLGFLSLPFLLYGMWRVVPTQKWPWLLVSSSFPVYLLHRFVQFDIQMVFGPVRSGWGYLVMTVIPYAASICIAATVRRFFPRCAEVAFGGR